MIRLWIVKIEFNVLLEFWKLEIVDLIIEENWDKYLKNFNRIKSYVKKFFEVFFVCNVLILCYVVDFLKFWWLLWFDEDFVVGFKVKDF